MRRPRVSLFEPDQPNPTTAIALPTPAENTQLVATPATHPRRLPRWLRLALALTLALGLAGAAFVLGSAGPPGHSRTRKSCPRP